MEQLQNRLSKFTGGVAIIHVGGFTETEMQEKKDRIDDSLHATKAAIEEGIVPGGGAALLYARESINVNNAGAKIVYNACGKPFEQILINAGYDKTDAQLLGKYKLVESGNDHWAGIDVNSGEVTNFLLSPNSGDFTAHTAKVPLILFTIKVANASLSISSAIINNDLP